jgi:SanA protein
VRSEPRSRRLLVRGLTAGLLLSGAAWLVDARVGRAARGRSFRRPEETPEREAALVLGARVEPDGRPSPVLEDRLLAGLDLFRLGRVQRLLVSGHAGAPEGDEPACMRAWLLARGAPDERVLVDPLGWRTLESVRRARRVFGLEGVVICTQAFHLGRSLYLAEAVGLDALGLVADRRLYQKRRSDRLREFFARQLAFVDAHLPPPPAG